MLVTRREALVVALVATMGAVAIAAGCSLVTSYDGFAGLKPQTGCGKEFPVRPPASSGGGNKTLVGAISFIRFIDQDDAGTLGYDLDGICTCPDTRVACRSKLGAGKPCDVPSGSGVDNAAGVILNMLYPPGASTTLSDALKHGRNGLVIQMENYNGERDDADVSVSFFNVVGVNGKTDGSGTAAFDGTDEMIVDEASLLNVATNGPKFFDTSAFVADGVLVASLDYSLRLEIPSSVLDASTVAAFVPMNAAHFIGKIIMVGSNGLKMTDAQFVGRIGEKGIFEQLSRIGICQDSGAFAGIKESTCNALDIPQSVAMDGKDMRCDALSLGMGFTVAPARLGGHAPANEGAGICGTEPATTCE